MTMDSRLEYDRWLSVVPAAARLRIPVRDVLALVDEQRLPASVDFVDGRRRLVFRETDLDAHEPSTE
ncbi:MAG: hypothetical protein OSA99_18835 [Acidimicrobiales bacterium]|nr:hypothetical protein [Acidimicrobiales bacterium]